MDELTPSEAANRGLVYILENEAMPGIIKVGMTTNLARRITELNNCTAVPLPFRCRYAATVEDPQFVEMRLHAAFAPHRLSSRREFFRVPVECVIAAIELAAIETVEASVEVLPTGETEAAEPLGITRAGAEADLIEMLARGEPIPSQDALVGRWGVHKGTAAKWLADFEARGLIRRQVVGRCKMVAAA
jgi:hypothetical protein